MPLPGLLRPYRNRASKVCAAGLPHATMGASFHCDTTLRPMIHPLTPIEDQLRRGAPDAQLQALFDALHADQQQLAQQLPQRRDPAEHCQAQRLLQACSAAQRLIVEVWLKHNPG